MQIGTGEATFDTIIDPYFGVTIQEPSDWTYEGDNPWNHADINPWHLPMVPIKELQPTPVDLLLEGKKTMILNLDAGDDASLIRLSVENTPFGMTLDKYVQDTIERIKRCPDAIIEVTKSQRPQCLIEALQPRSVMTLTFSDIDMQTRSTQLLTMYDNLAYIIQYDGLLEYYVNFAAAPRVLESVSIVAPPALTDIAAPHNCNWYRGRILSQ